jgi:uncharacterized protein (DUF1810 family)
MPSLERFISAQDQPNGGFESALAELRRGSKQGHWIWYVFPQLAGLGASAASQAFAINGAGEAEEYLEHPVLSSRLHAVTTVVGERLKAGRPLAALMGSPLDARKLVSSLTLFGAVSKHLYARYHKPAHGELAAAAAEVLALAAARGYPPCSYTLEALGVKREGS